MLEYDRIDVNEGIDVDKNELISKECIIKDMYVIVVTICL